MSTWFDGSGNPTDYAEIIESIEEHHRKGGTVYIGSDSHLHSHEYSLSSAIVLHGASGQRGGKYFITSKKFNKDSCHSLAERIIVETEKTIMIARNIVDLCPDIKVELHVDVSSAEKDEATSGLAKMVIGYVAGNGFNCEIKPRAFAAASVADKHTK